ncbi:hypothetical protein KQI84_08255 [bacterium]|nr:hypothetical protein [bacterium]
MRKVSLILIGLLFVGVLTGCASKGEVASLKARIAELETDYGAAAAELAEYRSRKDSLSNMDERMAVIERDLPLVKQQLSQSNSDLTVQISAVEADLQRQDERLTELIQQNFLSLKSSLTIVRDRLLDFGEAVSTSMDKDVEQLNRQRQMIDQMIQATQEQQAFIDMHIPRKDDFHQLESSHPITQ